ncbi:ECF transporter S component [Robertmurraya andreesenii]|uniref:Riboflavin transporter n=1 Tax=Anoxybacillus andreesenii TaxID=1325932 RepID=A0ABT9V8F9_9BACL|nr:ECF transporter S component [Robertmurraya andreesenii]MDQ0157203.1 riboflavin transporter FmnP [Robertmurraya andreesenii]
MKKLNVRALVSIGMLSSIGFVLMLLNFPLPPFPKFLMVDFSDIPALIAALIFGPGAAILVEFLKNLLDYILTSSDTGIPIGHLSNFVAGVMFVIPTYFIYEKLKTKKGMTVALITGTVTMAIVMSVLNYFVVLPAYILFMGFPAMSGEEIRQMVVAGILPFNMVKGLIISIVFMLLFARMGTWIGKQRAVRQA